MQDKQQLTSRVMSNKDKNTFKHKITPGGEQLMPRQPQHQSQRVLETMVVPCLAGVAAFGSSLAVSTFAQLHVLGVSTATRPPFPTLVGTASVALASLASHGATAHCRSRSLRKDDDRPFWPPSTSTALRVCLVGLCSFQLLGGRFWAVSPSSYTGLGSFARPRLGLPAKTTSYATDAQRRAIEALGRRHGCHTCGVSRGSSLLFHADHVPPNAVVRHENAKLWRRLLRRFVKQHFHPQCVDCSGKQARILSKATVAKRLHQLERVVTRRSELAHFHGLRPRTNHLAGGLVGAVTVAGTVDGNDVDHGNGFERLESFVKDAWYDVRTLVEDLL